MHSLITIQIARFLSQHWVYFKQNNSIDSQEFASDYFLKTGI
jgi:hypothetical protein